jgi:hypothetical protein
VESEVPVILTIKLGSGKLIEEKIDGWWWIAETFAADFDGDGNDDIALTMEDRGTTYGATNLHVYHVDADNGQLIEFGNLIRCPKEVEQVYTTFDSWQCVGASVVYKGERALLRAKMFLNAYDPAVDTATAHYLDMSWDGVEWLVEDMGLGEAYGPDRLLEGPKSTPPMLNSKSAVPSAAPSLTRTPIPTPAPTKEPIGTTCVLPASIDPLVVFGDPDLFSAAREPRHYIQLI